MFVLYASKGIFSIPPFMNPGRSQLWFLVWLTLILHRIFSADTILGVGKERKGQPQPLYLPLQMILGRTENTWISHPATQILLWSPLLIAQKENWIFSKARQVAGKYFLVNYLRMLGKVCCYLMSALRCLTLVIKLIITGTSTHQSKLGIRDILRRQSIKQHWIKSLGNRDGTCFTWKIRPVLPKEGQLACWKSILTTRNLFLALRVTLGVSVQACS